MVGAADENQYIFIGHSSEKFQMFEERPKIPPGYTLLLLSECDRTTGTADVNHAIELASQTPVDKTRFRVFEEGDPYPDLSLQILSDFYIESFPDKTTGTEIDYTAISRSGVFRVPINKDDWDWNTKWLSKHWTFDENTKVIKYSSPPSKKLISFKLSNAVLSYKTYKESLVVNEDDIDKKLVETQFQNSVYPPKQELKDILANSQTVDDLKKKLSISLQDLFEKLGPGLYIIPTCRSVKADAGKDEQDLFDYIQKEIEPELKSRLSLRHNFNALKYRKQKLNFLNSLKNEEKLKEEPWKGKYEKVRNNLRKIVIGIQNTRSKSVLRQQRGHKQRKTRRYSRK